MNARDGMRMYLRGIAVLSALALAIVVPSGIAMSQQEPEPTPVTIVNTPVPVAAPEPLMVELAPLTAPVPVAAPEPLKVEVAPFTVPVPVSGGVEFAPTAPFQVSLSVEIEASAEAGVAEFAVPAGRMLVVEQFNADVTVPRGQGVFLQIGITTDGVTGSHSMPATFQMRTSGSDRWASNETVRLYADPGSIVQVTVSRSGSGPASADVTISGYLVEA